MKTRNYINILSVTFLLPILFSNCKKNPVQSNTIQQGNTTIEINAIFPGDHFLYVRYNNVISAAINLTITFHLKDGQQKNIPVTIPAGYKNLQSWGDDSYVNSLEYTGHYDSTGNGSTPVIDGSWDVSSVEITSVNCPDKEYGFKVLTGSDNWDFYHPKDPVTSVSFISNKDSVSYSDYDFSASTNLYRTNLQVYGFYLFGSKVLLFSDIEKYPLTEGMTMNIPAMVYYSNSRNYGSQPDNKDSASNGSTIQLTITNLTSTHFDATFSGKLWSSRQADTLQISDGKIRNALLPAKVE